MKDHYLVPAEDCRTEFIERKSRFITTLRRVESQEEADAFIAEIKAEFPDATHNCVAYRIRTPLIERFSDDGEPGGTAGMPMLDVLKKEELFNVAVVVTRYFGGVLLGAGGLVRAYSKGAADGVKAAGVSVMEAGVRILLDCPYSFYDRFQRIAESFHCVIEDTVFAEKITVSLVLRASGQEDFFFQLAENSAGSVQGEVLEELFYPFKIID